MPARTTSGALAMGPSARPPRIELNTDDDDFDLGYDPATFEDFDSFPQPPPSRGNSTRASARREGRYSTLPILQGPVEGAAGRGESKQSRSAEAMQSPVDVEGGVDIGGMRASQETIVKAATNASRSSGGSLPDEREVATQRTPAPKSSPISPPSSNHTAINPATIPRRTSSSRAINGDRLRSVSNGDVEQPRKNPRKHKSLGAVPEDRRFSGRDHMRAHPDEMVWLSQGTRTMNGGENGGLAHHGSHGSRGSSRDFGNGMERYAGSTFSEQPTIVEAPPMNQHPALRYAVDSDLISANASQHWSEEKENILKGPFDYLEGHPGKDIRSQLITAFNTWLRVPADSLAIITKVVGMLHTASLLIDDVEDNSALRRGVPVAHNIFGAAQTINSANYVYFCALQELLRLNNPEVIQIYTDELLNLHRGQGMDLFWRDTLTCPSEDDYLEMVGNKTGGLFRLAIKLLCAESPSHNFSPNLRGSSGLNGAFEASAKVDYIPLVNTIGLLFQILDDYRNLSDTTYTANKGLCEDLTEGKFSFPVIHSIRSDPTNLVLINILKQKTENEEVKRYAMQYMEKTGSFAYTRRVLRGLTKKALMLVDEVEARVEGVRMGYDGASSKSREKLDGEGRGEGVRAILERMRVDRGGRPSTVSGGG